MSTFNWSNPSSNTVSAIKKEIASLGITPPNNANKNELIKILMDNKESLKAKESPRRGRKPKSSPQSPQSPGKQKAQAEAQPSNVKVDEKTYISSRLLLDEQPMSPSKGPLLPKQATSNQSASPKWQAKFDSPKESKPKHKHFTPPPPRDASPIAHKSPQERSPLRSLSPIQTEKKPYTSFNTERILLYAMIFAFIFSIILPNVGPVLLIGCFIAWICVRIMSTKKNKSKKHQ